MIIDGKKLATNIYKDLRSKLKSSNIKPRLDIILANNDYASIKYVELKKRKGLELGIKVVVHDFRNGTNNAELEELILGLNENLSVDGIMLQLPIFPRLDTYKLLNLISIKKDVDGLNPQTLGALFHGNDNVFVSATAFGIIKILDFYNINVEGKLVVMVGWNSFIGMPLEAVLTKRGATFLVTHSKTVNLSSLTKQADILITAVGKPSLITADYLKPGAVVIDAGFEKNEFGQISGDVDFQSVKNMCSMITPVPGGVGPMTVASLMFNVCKSAQII